MISNKIHIIISHPRGNSTFNYRINSFLKALHLSNYEVVVPEIKYPFETSFEGLFKQTDIIDGKNLIEITPKTNFIQKLASISQYYNFSPLTLKVLYGLNIIVYGIDLWYVPLHKNYPIDIKKDNIIIASGGPGSVFEMAYQLAKKYNCKLILDYRDPWNLGYDLLETSKIINRFKKFVMLKKELKIIADANYITVVSESLKKFIPSKFHYKTLIVENGSNFEIHEIKDQINNHPNKFMVVYSGTIYNNQLEDITFFKAFSAFFQSVTNKSSISLCFIGSNKNIYLEKILLDFEINSISVLTPRLTKPEFLKYLSNASMFLHLKYGNRSQIITSKNADYLMFKKPILLPVTDNGDIAQSITKYNAGYVCNGFEETLNALNLEYSKFLKKEKITLDNGDFSFLSRSEISKKLIKVIENLKN